MLVCQNCRVPIKPKQAFCQNCGMKIRIEEQTETHIKGKKFLLTARFKWALLAIVIIVVGLITVNMYFSNLYKPEKTINRFETAVKQKDYHTLEVLLELGGKDATLPEHEMKDYLAFLTKDKNLTTIVKGLEENARGLKLSPITDNSGNKLLILEKGQKKLFFYQQYYIKTYTFTVTVHSNIANTKVSLNGSSKLIKNANDKVVFKNVIPGDFIVKAENGTLKNEEKIQFQNALNNNVDIDLMFYGENEIKKLMGNFHQIEEMLYQTNDSVLGDKVWDDYQHDSKLVLDEYLPKLKGIASESFQKRIPEMYKSFYEASGEGGFLPDVSFDARMKIIENDPTKIKIKTIQLENESYHRSYNVFITTIKEKGKWVIDKYEMVEPEKEPLNLNKDEILKYLKDGDQEVEFVTTSQLVNPVKNQKEESYIYFSNKYSTFMAYTAGLGHLILDIPPNIIPDKYKLSKTDAEKLVREQQNVKNKPEIYVEFDHLNDLGDYVIHVYEIVIDDPATGEGHTATWGWYGVNPITREIYDELFRN
jgi:hypothetical protein